VFTNAQRVDIRYFLGWPQRYFGIETDLEIAMNTVQQDADTEALVVSLLPLLHDVDDKIVAARERLAAKELGSITLPGAEEIGVLRSEGRRLSGRLASILGVWIKHDVFSGSGPRDNHLRIG
jgi:hypothetical protein